MGRFTLHKELLSIYDPLGHNILMYTNCMRVFLEQLQLTYPDDMIVLVCDGAAWHKSGKLHIPEHITLLNIPPYTPEMNPIEQIWRELRSQVFVMRFSPL